MTADPYFLGYLPDSEGRLIAPLEFVNVVIRCYPPEGDVTVSRPAPRRIIRRMFHCDLYYCEPKKMAVMVDGNLYG